MEVEMDITVFEDYTAMIDRMSEAELDSTDHAATRAAFCAELHEQLEREYPEAEISVECTEQWFRSGFLVDGCDDPSDELDIEEHVAEIAQRVFDRGTFWRTIG
jgi:hypothetical protein